MAKKKETKKRPIRHKSAEKTTPKKKDVPVYTKTSEYLTDQEIMHYKQLLLDKMQELIGDVNSIEDGALKKSRLDASGDLSSMPIHMADIGTDNYDQEFALNLLDSERKILNEIIEALKRIDEQVYGICEVTGRGILKARLEARPWARYCIEYARLIEKGLIKAGEQVPENIELD